MEQSRGPRNALDTYSHLILTEENGQFNRERVAFLFFKYQNNLTSTCKKKKKKASLDADFTSFSKLAKPGSETYMYSVEQHSS